MPRHILHPAVALLLAGCTSTGDFLISTAPIANLANGARLTAWLAAPAPLTGTCTGVDDPADVHRVTSLTEETVHDIEVLGLLADSAYRCVLGADGAEAQVDVQTVGLPPGVPDTLEVTVDDGSADRGYLLFNHLVGDRTTADGRAVIVDREGRVRWYWEFAHYGGDVDAALTADGDVLVGGGYGLEPTLVGIDGVVRYVASAPAGLGTWHHHAEPQADGTYVALAQDDNTDPDDASIVYTGFRVEQRDPATDATVWAWSSQSAVDQGALAAGPTDGDDTYHANSVTFDNPADPDGVWINLRNKDAIIRVDKASGEVTWEMSPWSDDFALVTADGSPDVSEHWFYGQHAPELVGDTLYVYDNGTDRPGGDHTRVVAYRVDLVARTLTQLWEWTEDDWYEPIWGDVDLLPNGHVLVTHGHAEDRSASSPRSAWIELAIEGDVATPVWRLDTPAQNHMTYRAEQIDGCAIFANTAYCQE